MDDSSSSWSSTSSSDDSSPEDPTPVPDSASLIPSRSPSPSSSTPAPAISICSSPSTTSPQFLAFAKKKARAFSANVRAVNSFVRAEAECRNLTVLNKSIVEQQRQIKKQQKQGSAADGGVEGGETKTRANRNDPIIREMKREEEKLRQIAKGKKREAKICNREFIKEKEKINQVSRPIVLVNFVANLFIFVEHTLGGITLLTSYLCHTRAHARSYSLVNISGYVRDRSKSHLCREEEKVS